MPFDSTYLLFAIPGLLLTMLAQFYVTSTYRKYSKISTGKGKTGLDAALEIKNGENFPVTIRADRQPLGDYFDPTNNSVSLASDSTKSESVAQVAVVAHEMGHVQQKFSSSLLYNTRKALIPIANIGTQIGYILFFVGLAIAGYQLSRIGLIFFSSGVLISLLTLPVEINASKRGLIFIKKYNLISSDQLSGAKSVLTAAAFTYFAGLLTSILNLLYYVNILGRRRSD